MSLDLDAIKLAHPVVRALGRAYFRYHCSGFEHVPETPSLIVANHSGGKLPIDMFLLTAAWYDEMGYDRPLRALIHDMLFKLHPWIAKSLLRVGGMPANVTNAHSIFEGGHYGLVLPGGDRETFRPYKERYVVDFGGRSGFARVALKAGVPIAPCVTVGSHEIFFILTRGERIAKAMNLKRYFRASVFPIAFGWPMGLYLGPLPSPLPLPAKIESRFLPAVYPDREEHDHRAYGPKDIDDPEAAKELALVVQRRMQRALTEMGGARRFPVIG